MVPPSNAQPVILRETAAQDINAAVDHYRREAGRGVAALFVEELRSVFARAATFPASGSPRYAHELEIPDLRTMQLGTFPFTVFYLMREKPEVIRVLHSQRDIPAWLASTWSVQQNNT